MQFMSSYWPTHAEGFVMHSFNFKSAFNNSAAPDAGCRCLPVSLIPVAKAAK